MYIWAPKHVIRKLSVWRWDSPAGPTDPNTFVCCPRKTRRKKCIQLFLAGKNQCTLPIDQLGFGSRVFSRCVSPKQKEACGGSTTHLKSLHPSLCLVRPTTCCILAQCFELKRRETFIGLSCSYFLPLSCKNWPRLKETWKTPTNTYLRIQNIFRRQQFSRLFHKFCSYISSVPPWNSCWM